MLNTLRMQQKEIKDLILNSVDEVSSGVKLVRDTGEALKIIVDQIVLINTQLDAVTAASNEQSATLLRSTGQSIKWIRLRSKMQPWPRNPRLQSTALAIEAKQLRGIVSEFQIDAGDKLHGSVILFDREPLAEMTLTRADKDPLTLP
ncbi:hypothetical protein ACOJBO_08955 [Rhizobium beringeri]